MRLSKLIVLLCTIVLGSGFAFAQAEVFHGKEEIPTDFCLSDFTGPWANEAMACTGEDICFSGSFKYHYTLVFDPNGRIHYQETYNDTALKGVGVSSGKKYRRVGADTYSYSGDGEPPIVEHWTSALHLLGQGKGNNLLWKRIYKVTINANAEVTVEIEDEWMECR